MSDLVSDTFATVREMARRRGGPVPDLSHQGETAVPRRSRGKALLSPPAAARVPGLSLVDANLHPPQPHRTRRGQPTGLDGRAIPRGYRVSSFGALLGKEIQRRDWAENMAYGWVMGNWAGLVGPKIAQHTTVSAISAGEVYVECDTTAWATELRHMQPTVLKAIADKVGPDVITRLHISGPKVKSWRKGPLHVPGRGPRDTYG